MDRPTVADRPLRYALLSMKSLVLALLVVAAAFAPADRAGDLEQAVAQSLDHDRGAAQEPADSTVSPSEDATRAAEPGATVEPAGAAGPPATGSPRALPPTDTLPIP
jgi:hypothetical protein